MVFSESSAKTHEPTPPQRAVLLWLSPVFPSGASSGVLSNCGWCSITTVVNKPWLRSSSHLLGGGLGYPSAETGFPPPCVAEGWRPACWPLTQNAFLEASWNKVQRHNWQKLKLSFISICLCTRNDSCISVLLFIHSSQVFNIWKKISRASSKMCRRLEVLQFNCIFLEWFFRSQNLHLGSHFHFNWYFM